MTEEQKKKEEAKEEMPPPQHKPIDEPGFCSASCVCKECLRNEIKKPDVKTSDIYATCNLPKRFDHPHWFNGYGSQLDRQHPFYRTTSSEYGWYPPGIHSVTAVYFPSSQSFTDNLYATGMYRNYSLNMSAPDPPTKMC